MQISFYRAGAALRSIGRKTPSGTRAALCLAVMLTVAGFAPKADAAFNVAYINSVGGDVSYLANYGINVTTLNNPVGLTLAQLAPYDAIIIVANGGFSDPTTIGNVAADFADSGKGVVLTAFDYFSGILGGKIITAAYSPFIPNSSGGYVASSQLGTIYDPTSPILSGVTPALATTQYQLNVGLNAGAHRVADWTASTLGPARPAVAYTSLAHSSVVGLNLFTRADTISTDSQRLVANALFFSATGPATAVPEPASIIVLATGTLFLVGYSRKRAR